MYSVGNVLQAVFDGDHDKIVDVVVDGDAR